MLTLQGCNQPNPDVDCSSKLRTSVLNKTAMPKLKKKKKKRRGERKLRDNFKRDVN